MKKILPFIFASLIVGCATKPKEDISPKPQEPVVVEPEKISHKEPDADWKSYKIVVVTLDKNKKPTISKSIIFDELEDSLPYGKNGPKISINSFATENAEGRVLQINCSNIDIKQKFENSLVLKGWASEITCNRTNYFVIINKNSS